MSRAYFQGGTQIREHIQSGAIGFCLSQLKAPESESGHGHELFEAERTVLRDLDIANRVMGRLILRLSNSQIESRGFFAEAGLLVSGIIRLEERYTKAIREFYDRCRSTQCDLSAAQ